MNEETVYKCVICEAPAKIVDGAIKHECEHEGEVIAAISAHVIGESQ